MSRLLACVGIGAWGLMGCGRSSRDSGSGAMGAHAGREPAVAGGGMSEGGAPSGGEGDGAASPTGGGGDRGGATSGQAGMGGTAGNGVGGESAAGSAGLAGGFAGMAGTSGGQGGLAGAPSGEPGIVCGPWDHTLPDVECAPEEVCVFCWDTETSATVRCAPDPSVRPADYDAFLPTCMNPSLHSECDSPEDCPDGTLCQVRADDDYAYAGCSPAAPPCNAYCVACNSSADCANEQSCVPNELGSHGWFGATCGPSLTELLPAGDWLIGWQGDQLHYSWFRFTPSDTAPNQGTVRSLAVSCVACEALSCEGEGTYEIVGEEIQLDFPESCSLDYRLGNLASPPVPTSGFGSGALVSAGILAGVSVGPLYEALMYAPGVACDAEFTTCSFPPP